MNGSLTESSASADPFAQFARWFDEARGREPDATAMALATASRDGRPSARMVLLKGVDERGFVFYTNYRSRKARDIEDTRRASLLFYWPATERQIRIEGAIEEVSGEESDAYFRTRALESRWSVYASPQSEPVVSREWLELAAEEARKQFGDDVPRPSWWGGYRVVPDQFEFWQARPGRLHDRLRYVKIPSGWRRERLGP
jgi:pyridoxamine 5'-phosphate oxidase